MPGAAGTSRRRGAGDDRGDTQQPSARRPQEGDRGAIRGLFRRLAEALHPDRVQDEQDKATSTEVMKQIAVAYHAGDFARLVEIERTWAASGAPLATDDEGELGRRLATMERANEELRKQLRAIEAGKGSSPVTSSVVRGWRVTEGTIWRRSAGARRGWGVAWARSRWSAAQCRCQHHPPASRTRRSCRRHAFV